MWSLMRFLIKGSVAGGAVYLVYDQELLGPSDKSQAALQKAGEVVPPAVYQFSQYVCQQTGLQIPQLPAPPKIYFPVRDSWNAGTGRKKGEHRTEFRLRSLRGEFAKRPVSASPCSCPSLSCWIGPDDARTVGR